MATGNFKVKPEDKGVARGIQRLLGTLGDLRPALKNAATELTKRVWYRFAFKRDPDNRPWAPWAASTRANYRGDPRRKLMLHTRKLRDGSKFVPGRTSIRAVMGTEYGVMHEQPFGPASGKLPRRAFMFSRRNGGRALSIADEKYLFNAIRYQISKAAAGSAISGD